MSCDETTKCNCRCNEKSSKCITSSEVFPSADADWQNCSAQPISALYKKPLESYTSREIGMEGEHLATSYLKKRGYEIIERNWRTHGGEVDIVAQITSKLEGDPDPVGTTVLVEVKSRLVRGKDATLMPELSVDRRKQMRYRKMALLYLALHPDCHSVRFDVIAINLVGSRTARLRHLLGAFAWDEQL